MQQEIFLPLWLFWAALAWVLTDYLVLGSSGPYKNKADQPVQPTPVNLL